ncbi:Txe/YoeB family addiction module toxin [Tistrella mobilis]|uniref:Txe/YoeB family addiction module toxin n=1 Tax=Tistrella mobilis TaxID=171437 RepID=UPI0009ECD247|nr:Txe/YoeB family addiction module toxin [Tistrella mobilis]
MSIRLVWIQEARADYVHWQQADKAMLRRINDLVRDALRHPFEGIGKPERLRGDLSGYGSRRIDRDHPMSLPLLKCPVDTVRRLRHHEDAASGFRCAQCHRRGCQGGKGRGGGKGGQAGGLGRGGTARQTPNRLLACDRVTVVVVVKPGCLGVSWSC